MVLGSARGGNFGYRAGLPFVPPMLVGGEVVDVGGIQRELELAQLALGRLDGVMDTVPNPGRFILAYIRKESLLSSRIEGTQASLDEVLAVEAGQPSGRGGSDADEVVNHIRAMGYGLDRLESLPLSLRLIREIHGVLMSGARGEHRDPGSFRRTQNWIGEGGAPMERAVFVPPPPQMVEPLMRDLEGFIRGDCGYATLVRCGIAHAQFETIHPFLDGNGRLGRLLMTFMLCEAEVIRRPLLYLSLYLKRNRARYYELLNRTRSDGAWGEWLSFFLKGVEEVAKDAYTRTQEINGLQEELRAFAGGSKSPYEAKFVDAMFQQPMFTAASLSESVGCSLAVAYTLIKKYEQAGLVEYWGGVGTGGGARRFRFARYIQLLDKE